MRNFKALLALLLILITQSSIATETVTLDTAINEACQSAIDSSLVLKKIERKFNSIANLSEAELAVIDKLDTFWHRKIGDKFEFNVEPQFAPPLTTPYFYGQAPMAIADVGLVRMGERAYQEEVKIETPASYTFHNVSWKDIPSFELEKDSVLFLDSQTIEKEVIEDLLRTGFAYRYAEGGYNKVSILSRIERPKDFLLQSDEAQETWNWKHGEYAVKRSKYLQPDKFNIKLALAELRLTWGRKKLAAFLASRARFNSQPFISSTAMIDKYVFRGGAIVMRFVRGPTAEEVYHQYATWILEKNYTKKQLIKKTFFDKIGLEPRDAGAQLGALLQFYKDTNRIFIEWQSAQSKSAVRSNSVFWTNGAVEKNYYKAVGIDFNHGDNTKWNIDTHAWEITDE